MTTVGSICIEVSQFDTLSPTDIYSLPLNSRIISTGDGLVLSLLTVSLMA